MSSPAARRLPDDHPAWKDLRPLGYECTRWLNAMTMLQARWRKGRLPEALTAFLQSWMPQEPLPTPVPESFEICLEAGLLRADGALSPIQHPAWQALLHLPALRDFWTAELRASHYAHLLHIIPSAWCMDPTPLPPGSVIAGLGLSSWAELPQIEATGRSFLRHPVGENQVVLSTSSAIADDWLARYTLRDGQITLQDAFLL